MFIATAQGNQCTAAIEITAPSTQVGTITNEELVPLPNCIDSVTSPIITNQRAMFYRLRVGRGVAISVDSCGSCFDTIISVFADTNCNDNLHCMISNDDVGDGRFCTEPNTCDPLYGRAQFLSNIPLSCTRDESYLLAITGYGSSTGNYQLNFKTYGSCVTPVNDECSAAITLSVPSFTPFNVTYAAGDPTIFCGTVQAQKTLFYKVIGTGQTMIAHTCNPETNFESTIAVFTGRFASFFKKFIFPFFF